MSKYVHYEVDYTGVAKDREKKTGEKDKVSLWRFSNL